MLQVQDRIANEDNQTMVGKIVEVLWKEPPKRIVPINRPCHN